MLLLKHKVLKSIVLRRTKKGRAADLALPPRIVCFDVKPFKYRFCLFQLFKYICTSALTQVTLRRDFLDVVEEDYYTALYNESQAQFNTYAIYFFIYFKEYYPLIHLTYFYGLLPWLIKVVTGFCVCWCTKIIDIY